MYEWVRKRSRHGIWPIAKGRIGCAPESYATTPRKIHRLRRPRGLRQEHTNPAPARRPDLTIILDMPADKSMARVRRAKDRIEQRPLEYHEQVLRNYRAQAQGNPRYRVIDADRDPQLVREEIWQAVSSLKS